MNFYYKRKISSDFLFFIELLLFKISFDLAYKYVVSRVFGYVMLDYQPDIFKYIFSTVVFLIMIPGIIKIVSQNNISSNLLYVINLIYFIPACTLYSLAGLENSYFIFIAIYWFLVVYVYLSTPSLKISKIKSNLFFKLLIGLIIIASVIISGYYNEFKIHLNFLDVYGLRKEMKEMKLPLLIMYFMPAASVIIPISTLYFVLKKRYIMVFFCVFVQVLMFSMGGMKKTLFFIPIVFFLYYFFRHRSFKLVIRFFIILNFLAILEYVITESPLPFIANFIQRRTMCLPVMLTYNYIDFFSTNPPDYLAQSFLRWFGVKSDYQIPIQNLISGIYYGEYEGVASNGICGDAFSNFGWFTLFIYPFLFIIILKLFNSCSKGINGTILLLVSVIYAVYLTNGSLFSNLLTNGMIMVLFFLYFFPRNETV